MVRGYFLALLLGTPVGFLLGVSDRFCKTFDPIIQVLRPVSPLAWLPLGMVLFLGAKVGVPGTGVVYTATELAAIFTIAVCSMWPTVLNTAVGVRAVPQDYLNVAKVLRLSRTQTLFKILLPATLPYMFTGYRLSLGIAWLVTHDVDEAIFLANRVVGMTDGPGAAVGMDLEIPFPHPRSRDLLLGDPDFDRYRREVLTFLETGAHQRRTLTKGAVTRLTKFQQPQVL